MAPATPTSSAKGHAVTDRLLVIELPLFPLTFALISTGNVGPAALGMALATLPRTMYYAILAGMLPLFAARVILGRAALPEPQGPPQPARAAAA